MSIRKAWRNDRDNPYRSTWPQFLVAYVRSRGPCWRNPLVRLAVWFLVGQAGYWAALVALGFPAVQATFDAWATMWRIGVGLVAGAAVMILTARWFTIPRTAAGMVTRDGSPSGADAGGDPGA